MYYSFHARQDKVTFSTPIFSRSASFSSRKVSRFRPCWLNKGMYSDASRPSSMLSSSLNLISLTAAPDPDSALVNFARLANDWITETSFGLFLQDHHKYSKCLKSGLILIVDTWPLSSLQTVRIPDTSALQPFKVLCKKISMVQTL